MNKFIKQNIITDISCEMYLYEFILHSRLTSFSKKYGYFSFLYLQ